MGPAWSSVYLRSRHKEHVGRLFTPFIWIKERFNTSESIRRYHCVYLNLYTHRHTSIYIHTYINVICLNSFELNFLLFNYRSLKLSMKEFLLYT